MRSVRDRAWPGPRRPHLPCRAEPACARALSAPSPSRPRDPVLKPRAPFCLRAKKEGKEQSRANFPLLSLSRKESERKTTSVDYLRRRREVGGTSRSGGAESGARQWRKAGREETELALPTYLPFAIRNTGRAPKPGQRIKPPASHQFLPLLPPQGGTGGRSWGLFHPESKRMLDLCIFTTSPS